VRLVIVFAGLVAAAFAQWSEPVTLATGLQPYGAGPELVSHVGDSIWVFWMGQVTPAALYGRCFEADSWRQVETLAQSTNGLYWPAGVVDDSGRMLVAFYDGSYPVQHLQEQDTWGIYTATLAGGGWSVPSLAVGTMTGGFPTYVRLGKAQDGSVGLLWDESAGGMSATESVMVSRMRNGGWTPRCCIAPGQYPDVYCHCGSLAPGDSTDLLVAFSRRTTGVSEVEVWGLNDTLTGTPAEFAGALPKIARGPATRFLVITRGDTLLGAENHGAGWSQPVVIATGIGFGGASLCADPLGWGWVCWPNNAQQSVLASYNRGAGWSRPETVATSGALGSPRITSDGLGNLHCVWFDHTGGGSGELQHARRLGRPGVEETPSAEVRTTKVTTIIRGVLFLPEAPSHKPQAASLLDIGGRRVMDLAPGANDVHSLAPGVYFLRSSDGGQYRRLVLIR